MSDSDVTPHVGGESTVRDVPNEPISVELKQMTIEEQPNSPAESIPSEITSESEKEPIPLSPMSESNTLPNPETAQEAKVDRREIVPEDIKELTITNLDTGEEFVIGENDPDFEFDTFEIRGSDHDEGKGADDATANETIAAETAANTANNASAGVGIGRGQWLMKLFNYLYGSSSSKAKSDAQAKVESETKKLNTTKKTPFTKLSSFKFRKELGRGAFGRVLLAEAKSDGKLYALKIISKKNMRSSDKRQAKAERDILHAMTLKCPHPFTSGLKFAFQSENNLYLGMDYIPGGNLRELIKRFKCLPESWVRVYAAELVLAISHLHSMNVLYRDIKPHNVMIDARGHLVLIDFGLSKQEISHPRGALSLVGTPDYSAPEVLKTGVQQIEASNREKASSRKKKIPKSSQQSKLPMIGYGKAADWWSLGIMIYEMLCGVPTFRGADLRQTYQRILYADLEFVPDEKFSPAAKFLLTGLLKRDPGVRMGAWENPPQDIMGSPFFIGIRWDAIYERRVDGPWIPEVPTFGKQKSRKSSASGGAADGGAGGGAAGGAERGEGEHDPHEEVYADYKDAHRSQKIERPPAAAEGEEEESGSDSSEGEGEDDDDEYMNSKGMRDSVFLKSRGQLENQLADWSFMDEQVLRSVNEAEAREEEDAEERRRKKEARNAEKEKRRLARLTECDEAAEERDDEGVDTGASTPATTTAPTTGASEPNTPAVVTAAAVTATADAEQVVVEAPPPVPAVAAAAVEAN